MHNDIYFEFGLIMVCALGKGTIIIYVVSGCKSRIFKITESEKIIVSRFVIEITGTAYI